MKSEKTSSLQWLRTMDKRQEAEAHITFLEREIEILQRRVKLHDTGHIKSAINTLKARMREIKRYQNGDPDWYDEYLIGY